jgi:hypothetical protein
MARACPAGAAPWDDAGVAAAVHVWVGEDGPRSEAATVEVDRRSGVLRAAVTVAWFGPEPWRLDYEVSTHAGYATAGVSLVVSRPGGLRRLTLVGDGAGAWEVDGRPAPALDGALDVDIGLSVVANALPVLRCGLLAPEAQVVDLVVARVAVPDLTVERDEQRYEPLGGGRVRFGSGGFSAELTVDADGLVRRYPDLAVRVGR